MSARAAPARPRPAGAAGPALESGLVVATHGRHAIVETPLGARVLCHPRAKKNQTVVGDRVRWMASGDEGVIEQIEDRRNLLYREDAWRSKSFAANLDLVLVVVAGEPMFSEDQLTRALLAIAEAGIGPLIVQNKTDLPSAEAARARLAPYRRMGLEVLELSLKSQPPESRALLMQRLSGKATLVLGASGMGKSTLVNLLVPEAGAEVGELSRALGSGRHTTTTSRWYWLDVERRTAVIDSPGFQAFGLHHIRAEQLAGLMADLAPHLGQCRFHNCSHRHEPGCGLRAALDRGEIAPSRYAIYERLFSELSAPVVR